MINMQKISENNCVHSIGYHIIWCPKYRHCVLTDDIAIETKHIIAQTCAEYGWILHAIEIMPDHVHLFIQTDHQVAPINVVQTLKSISAVYIFTKFPKLKSRKFWGSGLWSRGTYYGSVGSVSEDAVKHYIETQYNRPHRNS